VLELGAGAVVHVVANVLFVGQDLVNRAAGHGRPALRGYLAH
jgi:hypothetical protein